MKNIVKIYPLFFLFFFIAFNVTAESVKGSFSGRVIAVSDGDTVQVLVANRPVKIRLQGVDCPEKAQDFGMKAKQFTSDMVFNKEVAVKSFGQDKYGRTIGEVILSDGRSLNKELVKEGFAWWYKHYSPNDKELENLESQARAAKKGLWVHPNPVPPWEFRHPTSKAAIGRITVGNSSTDQNKNPVMTQNVGISPIIGNKNSRIFHWKDCPGYSMVASKNRVDFKTAKEAQAAGFRAAKNCSGVMTE